MDTVAKFGPAGISDSFYEQGYKSTLEVSGWLRQMGLGAFEYQCGRGVRIKEETARKLGKSAQNHNIALSVHSPYYINLATPDDSKRQKSIDYILQTLEAADYMGATRVVVHSGSCANMSREKALAYAKKALLQAQAQADDMGFSHIHICPETMGKINQLGNLDEVLELCSLDERFLPTIDFGHLYTRSLGALKTQADFEHIFDEIENRLGLERLKTFHCHFSRIEFTAGGEKKHHTYADTEYGPDFEPIAEIICKRGLSPVIICESRGTQAEDARTLQDIYRTYCEKGRCEK